MKSFMVEPVGRPLVGRVTVAGDKSIGHRALMLSALASGLGRIRGLGAGADNAATRRAVEALGVVVEGELDELVIHGVGPDGLRAPAAVLDCGNSGTTMRLLCGLLSGQPFASRLTGDRSLCGRPMRRVAAPLAEMGARVTGASGARGDIYPPLDIAGRGDRLLLAIDYRLPIASAQVKSAILLAALYADGPSRVIEPGRSRDHTELMLGHLGAPIQVLGGGVIEVDPGGWERRLEPTTFVVPGDPSAAAFLVVAGLIAGAEVRIAGVGVNPTRTGFLDAVAAMGGAVVREPLATEGVEPIADLVVTGGRGLTATEVAGDLTVRSIDELPILAVLAARAAGVTEFRDADELRVKESDRIATTVAMLRGFGVEVEERSDGFTVVGSDRPLAAAQVDARGDHRIAMAAAIAALVADGPVRVDDVANVATSFPGFAATLSRLGARISESG